MEFIVVETISRQRTIENESAEAAQQDAEKGNGKITGFTRQFRVMESPAARQAARAAQIAEQRAAIATAQPKAT